MSLTVELFGYQPGLGAGNLLWNGRYPMRGGRFPKSHPCASNPQPSCALGGQAQLLGVPQPEPSDDGLGRFRALGYQASCFPEGDGICFYPPPDKEGAQVVEDVKACFGWNVTVRRL